MPARWSNPAGSRKQPTNQDLSTYYAGVEPRVRYGLLLRKLGRDAEAREVLADVVKRIELAPHYVRKSQAEWLAMARQALKV